MDSTNRSRQTLLKPVFRKKRKLTSATAAMSARACFRRLGVHGRPTAFGVRWPASLPPAFGSCSPSCPRYLGFAQTRCHEEMKVSIRAHGVSVGLSPRRAFHPICADFREIRHMSYGFQWLVLGKSSKSHKCQNVTEESVTATVHERPAVQPLRTFSD